MSSPSDPHPEPPVAGGPAGTPPVWPALAVFTVLRIALIAVLTVALMFLVPLIIALTIAIILQLPLSLLLLGRQRDRLNTALAARNAGRRAERDRLRSALRGDG